MFNHNSRSILKLLNGSSSSLTLHKWIAMTTAKIIDINEIISIVTFNIHRLFMVQINVEGTHLVLELQCHRYGISGV